MEIPFFPLPFTSQGIFLFNLKEKGIFCTYPTKDFFVKLISCIPWTVLGNKIIWIFLAETYKIGLNNCSGPDPALHFSGFYAWYWVAERPASPHGANSSSESLRSSHFAGLPTASITQLPRPSRVPEPQLHLETSGLFRALLRRKVTLICFDMGCAFA